MAGCGSADVTRPRLEASLAPTLTNLFVHQQTDLLGHSGVTDATVAAHASCDRGGLKVADSGPGTDWICMVTCHDEAGAAQEGTFELQARATPAIPPAARRSSSAWQR